MKGFFNKVRGKDEETKKDPQPPKATTPVLVHKPTSQSAQIPPPRPKAEESKIDFNDLLSDTSKKDTTQSRPSRQGGALRREAVDNAHTTNAFMDDLMQMNDLGNDNKFDDDDEEDEEDMFASRLQMRSRDGNDAKLSELSQRRGAVDKHSQHIKEPMTQPVVKPPPVTVPTQKPVLPPTSLPPVKPPPTFPQVKPVTPPPVIRPVTVPGQKTPQQIEAEKAAAAKLEADKIARETAAKLEAERVEKIRIDNEKAKADKLERERLIAEKAEKDQAERLEKERLAQIAREAELDRLEKIEKERVKRLQEIEKERLAELERQKEIEQEIEKQKEIDRLAELQKVKEAELAKQQQLERQAKDAELREHERLAEEARLAEQARLDQIKAENEEQKEVERLAEVNRKAEMAEKLRLQKEAGAERLRLAQLEVQRVKKAEQDRYEAERVKSEQAALLKAKLAAEKAEKMAADKALKEKVAAESLRKSQADKAAKEAAKQQIFEANQAKLEADKIARETAAQLEAERVEKVRIENEKAKAEKEQRELNRVTLKKQTEDKQRFSDADKVRLAQIEKEKLLQEQLAEKKRLPRQSMMPGQSNQFQEPVEIEVEEGSSDEPDFFKILNETPKQTIKEARQSTRNLDVEESQHFMVRRNENLGRSRPTITNSDYEKISTNDLMRSRKTITHDQFTGFQSNRLGGQLVEEGFVDFSEQRVQGRIGTERRKAVVKVQDTQALEDQIDTSQEDLTDKDESEMHQINEEEVELYLSIPQYERKFKPDFTKIPRINIPLPQVDDDSKEEVEDNSTENSQDFMKLIASNESTFKALAEVTLQQHRDEQIKKSASLHTQIKQMQTVISAPTLLSEIKAETATCITLHFDLILVGTASGQLLAFNRESQQPAGVHKQDSKDFINNAVTCIDIHQLRPDYCVIGFQNGQMILVNIRELKKSIKVVKDHHKVAVTSVKFCDWKDERPHADQGPDHKCKKCENPQTWMFLSCDHDGKVVQNTVTNVGFGVMYANDIVFVDPDKNHQAPLYQVIAPRISSVKYPMVFEDDIETIVAVGSTENVAIWQTPEKKMKELRSFPKPMRYISENMKDVMPVISHLPVLAWGFGKTPRNNYTTFSLLAIAWGPLIQLVVFEKHNENSPLEDLDFNPDGYYIISPDASCSQELDLQVQSLHWIDESLLVAVTTSNEVRVMLTTQFLPQEFKEPAHLSEYGSFAQMDPRSKYLAHGSKLLSQQQDIEMERITKLAHQLVSSRYGAPASQTCTVLKDQIVCLTKGGIYKMHHLHWLESLGNIEQQVAEDNWIKVFAQARAIYKKKIKGFRIKDQSHMKEQMKDMINNQVFQMLHLWKARAQKDPSFRAEIESRIQNLIRALIEFCVEVAQPVFLFDTLLKKFHQEGKSYQFAEELKPYILSGVFSECTISENVLNEQVLAQFEKRYSDSYELTTKGVKGSTVPPALSQSENFEKILLNFRFENCSEAYRQGLIQYCIRYKLSSGLIYMCLQTYGKQGPLKALQALKDFYLEQTKSEATKYSRDQLLQLNKLAQNSFDRIQIERSSQYVGLKMLWICKRFLLGKKFPTSIFSTREHKTLCHDILDFVTQEAQIKILTEIDAELYFQTVSIVYNFPSNPFDYIKDGLRDSETTMTHDSIVKRVVAYFNRAGSASPQYLYYLCFIASIAEVHTPESVLMYYDVLLRLLKNPDLLKRYNRGILAYMSPEQVLRKFETKDVTCTLMTEKMLLQLIDKMREAITDERLQELLRAVASTNFNQVKLVLYELDHDYLRCLRSFMKRKSFDDGFQWIGDKHLMLQQRARENTKDPKSKKQLESFEKEILNWSLYLFKQDVKSTVKLFDTTFKAAHQEMLNKLESQPDLALYYIRVLLELKKDHIKDLFASGHNTSRGGRMSVHMNEHHKWTSILTTHVRLLCEIEPESVTHEVKRIIKDNFYPMEECLKIVTEFKQIEAMALLFKKIGSYTEAITLYLELLNTELDYTQLKRELYYYQCERLRHVDIEVERQKSYVRQENRVEVSEQLLDPDVNPMKLLSRTAVKTVRIFSTLKSRYNKPIPQLYTAWVEKYAKNIEFIDRILLKINKIVKKHAKEVFRGDELWSSILDVLFKMQFHPAMLNKSYCKRYVRGKIIEFCRAILSTVPFSTILQVATHMSKNLKLRAVKALIFDVLSDKSQEYNTTNCASVTQVRDLMQLICQVRDVNAAGVAFSEESFYCGICEMSISGKSMFKSSIVVVGENVRFDESALFECKAAGKSEYNHSFHVRCMRHMIETEQAFDKQNKKALEVKDMDRFLRCPTCYPKSQDFLLTQTTKESKRKVTSDSDDSDSSKSSTKSTSSTSSTKLQNRDTLQVNFQKKIEQQRMKRQMQREKSMKKFEESLDKEQTLRLYDFKY